MKLLCRSFEVSASGYYDWRERQSHPCRRALQDQQLKQQIARIHLESRGTYGSPRIQFELALAGQRHGRNRIGRLMREQTLWGRQKRRFRVCTTDSNHDEPIAPNRLSGRRPPIRPDEVWVADITYIRTAQGWLYVAAILDLFSRRVVGWAVGQRIDTALVLAAWQMACTHRQPPSGLVFHSDRGVQYASGDYRRALALSQVVPSMSRKANCYDNAVIEAFWSTLKLELVYRTNFTTTAQAQAALFDYIEVFYNRRRRHSALGYQSPAEFEASNN
jgi:transposase InsO family protein